MWTLPPFQLFFSQKSQGPFQGHTTKRLTSKKAPGKKAPGIKASGIQAPGKKAPIMRKAPPHDHSCIIYDFNEFFISFYFWGVNPQESRVESTVNKMFKQLDHIIKYPEILRTFRDKGSTCSPILKMIFNEFLFLFIFFIILASFMIFNIFFIYLYFCGVNIQKSSGERTVNKMFKQLDLIVKYPEILRTFRDKGSTCSPISKVTISAKLSSCQCTVGKGLMVFLNCPHPNALSGAKNTKVSI